MYILLMIYQGLVCITNNNEFLDILDKYRERLVTAVKYSVQICH